MNHLFTIGLPVVKQFKFSYKIPNPPLMKGILKWNKNKSLTSKQFIPHKQALNTEKIRHTKELSTSTKLYLNVPDGVLIKHMTVLLWQVIKMQTGSTSWFVIHSFLSNPCFCISYFKVLPFIQRVNTFFCFWGYIVQKWKSKVWFWHAEKQHGD